MHPETEPVQTPTGFALLERLAAGPSTVVYRARSAHHGAVVLKVWRSETIDARARVAFDRETRLHQALSPDAAPHPNIVAFVAAAEGDEAPLWLATRPGGEDLAMVLRRRRPGLVEALRLAHDVLDGLASLHDRNLVHGDLTPANILVYNGRAVLCDLGLAGATGDRGPAAQLGTPEYMAPELRADPGRPPDTRTDVYGAAVIIGEILAGITLPGPLDHLVYTRALSQRRDDRPRDAAHFARLLTRAAQNGTERAQRPRPNRVRRPRIIAVTALIAVIAVTTAVGTWWWTHRGPISLMEAPTDGAQVASPVYARGKSDVGPHESLWLMTRVDERPYELVLSPATVDSEGNWLLKFNLGQGPCDEGRDFILWAVAGPDAGELDRAAMAARSTNQLVAEIDRLPDDSRVIDSATVTLVKFQGNDRCPEGPDVIVESTAVPDAEVP